MNCGEEGSGILGVSRGDAAPTFEVQEGIFDKMAQLIEVLVIFTLNLTVSLWRNDRLHALQERPFKDGVGVIAFVDQQYFG